MDILTANGLSKKFPGVKALDNVDFTIRKGEIHGLIGENGAGKSTFIKIVSGAYQADGGDMRFDGSPHNPENPEIALKKGIAVVHQELSLCENMSVADNILINRHPLNGPFIDRKEQYKITREQLSRFELQLSPNEQVGRLSLAEKEQIEILRALSYQPKLLILDEATGPLSRPQAERLFELIGDLRDRGVSILYISHNIGEVISICDRITIFRDGRFVNTVDSDKTSEQNLAGLMVGREIGALFPPREKKYHDRETVLEIRNYANSPKFQGIDFHLEKGEILGIAGLIGSGRTDLALSIFGAAPKTNGEILLSGAPVRIQNPKDAIKNGIAYLSEDRRLKGLFLPFSIADNLLSVNLDAFSRRRVVDRNRLLRKTLGYIESLRIKAVGPIQKVGELSGGNQQKTLFAKWISLRPHVLIIDEPTRGVDIAAKQSIYELLQELVSEGVAVIMISSELPEILGMSDRIMIMDSGRMVDLIPNDADVTEDYIMNKIVNSRRKG